MERGIGPTSNWNWNIIQFFLRRLQTNLRDCPKKSHKDWWHFCPEKYLLTFLRVRQPIKINRIVYIPHETTRHDMSGRYKRRARNTRLNIEPRGRSAEVTRGYRIHCTLPKRNFHNNYDWMWFDKHWMYWKYNERWVDYKIMIKGYVLFPFMVNNCIITELFFLLLIKSCKNFEVSI